MFAVVKYHAVDYLHEILTRQKLTVNWLLLPSPHSVDHSDKYCYKGRLNDDIYRRPWTRGKVFSACKLMSCDSVLTEWKKHITLESFLESLEIVPSSNPNSQNVAEEVSSLLRRDDLHLAKDEQDKFEVVDPEHVNTQTGTDIFLHDEIVFADYLSEFHKQLPNLHSLSCRLKIISLKDPLINSKGEPLTEEMFFSSCLLYPSKKDVTDRATEKLLIKEDYKPFPQLDDESLMPPLKLGISNAVDFSWNEGFSPLSEIKFILPLIPEDVTVNVDSCTNIVNKGELYGV
ncbi:uncharacterized protein LOC129695468 [Leucoraja erinacea]|uniref:uncharacterized protein LOC129695468 n=1 Tax=Leucoraja erinaceus TaxID=7782 RepID=UPI0024560C00|nr:uncharacterized protein LOC129695468 [Leucoraja erinacea]